ncbi:MAG: hypothetical protein FJ271_00860 [Planctomycetes bacterium]|nr:hypothetical protein [Planctomycetota bacterium]
MSNSLLCCRSATLKSFVIRALAVLACVGLAGAAFGQQPALVRLSRSFHPRFFLSYSPDGSHLVYSQHHANRRASQQVLMSLRIMKADGSDDRPLLAAYDRDVQIQQHAVWSPDGKRLALSGGGNDTGNAALDVFLCDMNNFHASNLRKLVKGGGVVGEHPGWSPDGKQLVMTNITGSGLWIIDADGKNRRSLIQPGGNYTRFPAWSPDGKRIAFASDRDGNSDIYWIRPDGSELTRVTNHPSIDSHPRWSPDGQWLAFVSYRDGNSDIWLCRPDGQGLRNLTAHAAHDAQPAWSPDGKHLAFVSDRDGGFDIYRLTVPADLAAQAARLPERRPAGPVTSKKRPDGLVCHFNFDQGVGNKLMDRAGPNHGDLMGARWVKRGAGHALSFNGASDYVTCGLDPALHLTGPLTITVWVNLNEKPHNHYVVCKHGWNIYVGPDFVPRFETRSAADKEWNTLAAAKPIKSKAWTRIAAVFDPAAKEMRIHVDGTLSARKPRSDNAIAAVAGYPLELGRYGPGKSQHLHGMIDEVRIFSRALSPEMLGNSYENERQQLFAKE